MVEDLILHSRWNTAPITQVFNQRDVNLILVIPITSHQNDNFYWLFEEQRFYSMKSAYQNQATKVGELLIL